jgi:hypothetical protein
MLRRWGWTPRDQPPRLATRRGRGKRAVPPRGAAPPAARRPAPPVPHLGRPAHLRSLPVGWWRRCRHRGLPVPAVQRRRPRARWRRPAEPLARRRPRRGRDTTPPRVPGERPRPPWVSRILRTSTGGPGRARVRCALGLFPRVGRRCPSPKGSTLDTGLRRRSRSTAAPTMARIAGARRLENPRWRGPCDCGRRLERRPGDRTTRRRRAGRAETISPRWRHGSRPRA